MEGEKILLDIIDNYFSDIDNYDRFNYDLYIKISNNHDNFITVPDEYLNKSEKKVRDLLSGKLNYGIDADIDYNKIDEFLNTLKNNINPSLLLLEDVLKLKDDILNKHLIEDTLTIYDLVDLYDTNDKEKDLLLITKYINQNNLEIEDININEEDIINIKFKKKEIDEKIIKVLEKIDIDYLTLPSNIINDLKECNTLEFLNTYRLIKKNKVEDYGIIHLIKNKILKLNILLYSNENIIKEVIDTINIPEFDINTIKDIINYIPIVLYKDNYKNFIDNIDTLKDLIVNYKLLLSKEPLFMLINNNVLKDVLNELDKYDYIRRDVVNKLYKVLTYNPYLLVYNAKILKDLNISNNYDLLKVDRLENRIEKLENKNNIYKDIITNIYNEVKND